MPDTYRIIFTKRAADDLEGIFRYISQRSPGAARSVISELVDAIDSLDQFPHRYPVIEQSARTRPETRTMPVPPYVIYYRVLENQKAVRVITVRHGARLPPSDS
jgi:addiction module RelE/StbE family toxin